MQQLLYCSYSIAALLLPGPHQGPAKRRGVGRGSLQRSCARNLHPATMHTFMIKCRHFVHSGNPTAARRSLHALALFLSHDDASLEPSSSPKRGCKGSVDETGEVFKAHALFAVQVLLQCTWPSVAVSIAWRQAIGTTKAFFF